ncbi:MAG: hypothetical protein FJW34_27175 [Acidobacteria bacterium]|nr:hypothetical protein [Acidobacteriota bacterium]
MNRTPVAALSVLTASLALASGQPPRLQAGVSVQLPVTRHAVPPPEADQPGALIAALTAKGNIYLGITPVSPGELADKLKAWLSGRGGKALYVKADARAEYAGLAELWDAARQAGTGAVILLTSQKDSPEPSYPVPPKGLEVSLGPPEAARQPLHAGTRPDLKGNPKAVGLKPDGRLPVADVVRAVDECRGAGAKVIL